LPIEGYLDFVEENVDILQRCFWIEFAVGGDDNVKILTAPSDALIVEVEEQDAISVYSLGEQSFNRQQKQSRFSAATHTGDGDYFATVDRQNNVSFHMFMCSHTLLIVYNHLFYNFFVRHGVICLDEFLQCKYTNFSLLKGNKFNFLSFLQGNVWCFARFFSWRSDGGGTIKRRFSRYGWYEGSFDRSDRTVGAQCAATAGGRRPSGSSACPPC
jgi:hypothetical protein